MAIDFLFNQQDFTELFQSPLLINDLVLQKLLARTSSALFSWLLGCCDLFEFLLLLGLFQNLLPEFSGLLSELGVALEPLHHVRNLRFVLFLRFKSLGL
jgi:hypothetical protein